MRIRKLRDDELIERIKSGMPVRVLKSILRVRYSDLFFFEKARVQFPQAFESMMGIILNDLAAFRRVFFYVHDWEKLKTAFGREYADKIIKMILIHAKKEEFEYIFTMVPPLIEVGKAFPDHRTEIMDVILLDHNYALAPDFLKKFNNVFNNALRLNEQETQLAKEARVLRSINEVFPEFSEIFSETSLEKAGEAAFAYRSRKLAALAPGELEPSQPLASEAQNAAVRIASIAPTPAPVRNNRSTRRAQSAVAPASRSPSIAATTPRASAANSASREFIGEEPAGPVARIPSSGTSAVEPLFDTSGLSYNPLPTAAAVSRTFNFFSPNLSLEPKGNSQESGLHHAARLEPIASPENSDKHLSSSDEDENPDPDAKKSGSSSPSK